MAKKHSSPSEGSQSSPSEASQSEDKSTPDSSEMYSSSTAGNPSPSAQIPTSGKLSRDEEARRKSKIPAGNDKPKEEVIEPDVPASVAEEPLIKAAMEVYGLGKYIPDKKLYKKISGNGVKKNSVLEMYKSDPSFKQFADERMKLMVTFPQSKIGHALGNLCNLNALPDADHPKRLKGFNHWLRDHVPSVEEKAIPKTIMGPAPLDE
jgi:hypothetical protein